MNQNNKHITVSPFLKWVLLINVFSTGPFGLVLLLFGDVIGELTGIDHSTIIRFVGVGLIVFVSIVFWTAKQKQFSVNMLLSFAIIDLIWVIDSMVLIIFFPLTMIGVIGVAVVAFMVMILSILEFSFYFINRNK